LKTIAAKASQAATFRGTGDPPQQMDKLDPVVLLRDRKNSEGRHLRKTNQADQNSGLSAVAASEVTAAPDPQTR
jgi:hypothetical protein